jgi:hypothetical protein
MSTPAGSSAWRDALAAGVTPDEFTLAQVNPDEQDFWQLRDSIAELAAAGRPTAALESNLWHKIRRPLLDPADAACSPPSPPSASPARAS